jgi:hypothetical protein
MKVFHTSKKGERLMANEAGKGDKQRPTDHEKFAFNYENIFKKNSSKEKNEELRTWYTPEELKEKKEGNDV